MKLRQFKKKIRKVAQFECASAFRIVEGGIVFRANLYLFFYRTSGPATWRDKHTFLDGRLRSLGYCGV